MRIFLCGDVMTGRGIDQALPHPCSPILHEGYVQSAVDYLRLAERANGPVPRPVDFAYIWGAALDEWRRAHPHVRIVNLETSITRSDAFEPKGINYRRRIADTATEGRLVSHAGLGEIAARAGGLDAQSLQGVQRVDEAGQAPVENMVVGQDAAV